MKLLSKSILYFILISIPVLIIAGIVSYNMIYEAVDENTKEILWKDKLLVEKLIDTFESPHEMTLGIDNQSAIKIDSTQKTGFVFYERVKMDAGDEESVRQNGLRSYYKKGSVNYQITIVRSALEEDDLIENLISTLVLIMALLIISFFFLNIFLSKSLWKPYFLTIESLGKFDLVKAVPFVKTKTTTSEFVKLNESLKIITEKMQHDFSVQKEFVENASHEMQTPLAVIKAKLEQFMQSPNLKEDEFEKLLGVESSVNKLASLNKSLLLLAKIENKQFHMDEEVSVKEALEKAIDSFDDFVQEKSITLSKKMDGDIRVKMNSALLDILIGNLIQNAIRHNIVNGKLAISINNGKLVIANTGPDLGIDTDKIFDRFKKGDASNESIGLGLAIVKSIVNSYSYKVDYYFVENMHTFTISF